MAHLHNSVSSSRLRAPSMSRAAILVAALLAITLLAACRSATIEGRIPERVPRKGTGEWLAGAAKEDITPIPGFSMGGHAIAGKMSRGFWTRLYARAVYLEDEHGTPLVMVSCDLWSVSGGLTDRIAERIVQTPELRHIGRENLLIAATHTHQSEGNFASSAAFNDFAQPLPGFDPELFAFLVDRITAAITRAYQQREPVTLALDQTTLSGFFRNRSMEPFLLNPEQRDILSENDALPLCQPTAMFPDPRACRAVEPHVNVLRATAKADDHHLVAATGFVAVHPTIMSHDLEAYSGDLFGAAAILAESTLATPAHAPVVALFNGPEGDITTTWVHQDRQSLLRLASILADGLTASPREDVAISGTLEYQFERAPVAGQCFTDGGVEHCTTSVGVPGAAAFAGAEDGRTVLEDMGFREGRRGAVRGDQGAKLPAFDLDFGGIRLQITNWLTGTSPLPRVVPLGVYRIGDLIIATLPGEFTTTMGRRIRASLRQASPTTKHVALVGLANEYLNYFTTPEEYDLQHYEAGMTMYGQASGELIRHHLTTLTSELDGKPAASREQHYEYQAGRIVRFKLRDVGAPLYRPDDGLSVVLQDLDSGDPRRDYPCVCWNDGPNSMKQVMRGRPTTPHVRVVPPDSDEPIVRAGRRQDDQGLNFITVVTAATNSTSRWCSFWMPSPDANDDDGPVAFGITDLDGKVRHSPAFDLHASFTNGCLAAGG